MMEVTKELLATTNLGSQGLAGSLTSSLNGIVWRKFEEEKQKGTFKRKIWLFNVDISDEVEKILTKWFGINPFRNS